ncbi:hypothetical protein GCM10010441_57490 [Kitasatospora paracochleata]
MASGVGGMAASIQIVRPPAPVPYITLPSSTPARPHTPAHRPAPAPRAHAHQNCPATETRTRKPPPRSGLRRSAHGAVCDVTLPRPRRTPYDAARVGLSACPNASDGTAEETGANPVRSRHCDLGSWEPGEPGTPAVLHQPGARTPRKA